MIKIGRSTCPNCGGVLKNYDKVLRIVRSKYQYTYRVKVRRKRCPDCGRVHRELPKYLFPHKQYEKEVILGAINGQITPNTLGYEDYPCEMTFKRWKLFYSE